MRRAHVGDPVAHRFVDRILQRAASRIHAHHLRTQHAHPRDVQRLPRHVFRAHVHDAFQTQMRRDGGRSHAVLAGAGFRNDARLAHLHGKESLADSVIDFVRAGVQQILALQIDPRPAQMRCQPRSKLQRRSPPREILQQSGKLRLKLRIRLRQLISMLQLKQRHHQRLRHIPPAIRPKPPSHRRRVNNP